MHPGHKPDRLLLAKSAHKFAGSITSAIGRSADMPDGVAGWVALKRNVAGRGTPRKPRERLQTAFVWVIAPIDQSAPLPPCAADQPMGSAKKSFTPWIASGENA